MNYDTRTVGSFRELEDMSERLNRVFSRPTLRNTGKENLTVADWMPTVDISETESEYLIKAELPEVRKEDVKVTVENGVLTLQGERRQEKEEKGRRFHRVERSYGSFVRSFTLPESVDEGGVKAEYKDGVLALHLPKSEKVKPKAIDVKVAKDSHEGPARRAFVFFVCPPSRVFGRFRHDQLPHVLVEIQPQYIALPVTGLDPKIAVRLAVPAIHDVLNR